MEEKISEGFGMLHPCFGLFLSSRFDTFLGLVVDHRIKVFFYLHSPRTLTLLISSWTVS